MRNTIIILHVTLNKCYLDIFLILEIICRYVKSDNKATQEDDAQ